MTPPLCPSLHPGSPGSVIPPPFASQRCSILPKNRRSWGLGLKCKKRKNVSRSPEIPKYILKRRSLLHFLRRNLHCSREAKSVSVQPAWNGCTSLNKHTCARRRDTSLQVAGKLVEVVCGDREFSLDSTGGVYVFELVHLLSNKQRLRNEAVIVLEGRISY